MIDKSWLDNPNHTEEEREMLRDQYDQEQEELKDQQEWLAEHPELSSTPYSRPAPIVQPIVIDKMKVITFRFRESGYNDLRCIAQVKGSQLFGSKNALDLSMIIRMALEEFIAREKKV